MKKFEVMMLEEYILVEDQDVKMKFMEADVTEKEA